MRGGWPVRRNGSGGWRERLRAEHDAVVAMAKESGKPVKHRQVVVDSLTSAVAYDRLARLDRQPGLSGKLDWKQGRTERCQYRFVGELPDGLSAQERNAILTDFCDELGKDGWMVVGAIHLPDATNDRRNFHVHIDLFDRKAEWLDEEGCWDFEHVVRKNGKPTHPYRHNKVRYEAFNDEGKLRKFDVAGFMRTRFIDTVNAVVGDRADVVCYLHGTYKDNGIELTPLEHMGNRAMGLEKRGIATEVGSRNARRIAEDDVAACEARAAEAEVALASELAIIQRLIANDLRALAAADRYAEFQRRLIRRRLQAALAETTIAMARSRADAVIRTLTPAPGHRVKLRAGDVDLLAAARRHIASVERHSPSPAECEAERRLLAKLEHRAALEWKVVEAATTRAAGEQAPASITYRPRDPAGTSAAATPSSRYDDQRRKRLALWMRKHISNANLLVFDGGEVRLGKAVPPAIDTLMRRFSHEPSFQHRLLAERRRRGALISRSVSGSPAPSAATPSPPVGMIPVAVWEMPQSTSDYSSAAAKRRNALDEGRGTPSTAVTPRLTDLRSIELAKRATRLRETGWAMLASGKAFIVKSATGYTITGMPDGNADAVLHRDFADELERRLATLARKHPEGAAIEHRPVPLADRQRPGTGGSVGRDIIPDWPDGPPAALRDAPALRDAVGLERAPRLRDARGLGGRVAFASDLASPAPNKDGNAPEVADGSPHADGKTGIRKQAEVEALDGKTTTTKPKGPRSAATPVIRSKPGHER